jgi:hypothetical protein
MLGYLVLKDLGISGGVYKFFGQPLVLAFHNVEIVFGSFAFINHFFPLSLHLVMCVI